MNYALIRTVPVFEEIQAFEPNLNAKPKKPVLKGWFLLTFFHDIKKTLVKLMVKKHLLSSYYRNKQAKTLPTHFRQHSQCTHIYMMCVRTPKIVCLL